MLRVIVFCFLFVIIACRQDEEDARIVMLDQGGVKGVKYWNGEFYEFYGVPYASVPVGKSRYLDPLPPTPWKGVIEATEQKLVCPQTYYTGEDEEPIVAGEEDCLVLNLMVPKLADENNLVPVIVYVHSGAFAVGSANQAKLHYVARHDVIVISFNFRLGAIGFACLGTEDIPGNAGMKDAVAALKWINKNIKKFGGDPNKVTLAGFSTGAAMAELLALSKKTDGLFDKLILESGSALAPYAINRDPIATAKNIAVSVGYKDTGKIEDLNEFYLKAATQSLAVNSLHFFLPNSTFGFATCIEHDHENAFLTKSPLDILKSGDYKKIPVITGFANKEGLSRSLKFETWSDMMNKNFADFLPADLKFDSQKSKEDLIKDIKNRYFKGKDVSLDILDGYIDYFSASMFKYPVMKSAELHAANSNNPIYLYEFSYVGQLNMKHNYGDRIKGASHRDQSAYILDFHSWTNTPDDLDVRDRLTMMWTDFMKYEDPTAYETVLVELKWLPYTSKNKYYLHISKDLELKTGLFSEEYKYWDKIYEKYYWNPTQMPKPSQDSKKKSSEKKSEQKQKVKK